MGANLDLTKADGASEGDIFGRVPSESVARFAAPSAFGIGGGGGGVGDFVTVKADGSADYTTLKAAADAGKTRIFIDGVVTEADFTFSSFAGPVEIFGLGAGAELRLKPWFLSGYNGIKTTAPGDVRITNCKVVNAHSSGSQPMFNLNDGNVVMRDCWLDFTNAGQLMNVGAGVDMERVHCDVTSTNWIHCTNANRTIRLHDCSVTGLTTTTRRVIRVSAGVTVKVRNLVMDGDFDNVNAPIIETVVNTTGAPSTGDGSYFEGLTVRNDNGGGSLYLSAERVQGISWTCEYDGGGGARIECPHARDVKSEGSYPASGTLYFYGKSLSDVTLDGALFGLLPGTKLVNVEVDYAALRQSLNVAVLAVNCQFKSGVNIYADDCSLYNCVMGDLASPGGATLETVYVDTGVNDTILSGCRVDIAITDNGSGTIQRDVVVF